MFIKLVSKAVNNTKLTATGTALLGAVIVTTATGLIGGGASDVREIILNTGTQDFDSIRVGGVAGVSPDSMNPV